MAATLTAIESRLCAAIAARRAALESDLAAHVAIPTGKGYVPGLEAYRGLVVARLAALGATVREEPGDPRPAWLRLPGEASAADGAEIVPPVVIASRRLDGVTPHIMIAGHLDTVHDPAGPFQKLRPGDEPGTVVGPGAVDMKGGILVVLAALEALAEVGASVSWTVLLNSDEETGSFHSARHLRETAQRHDVGIAVEPALPGGGLAIERMGSGQFMIEVFGRAAHAGREFTKGVSAVTALGGILVQLGALARPDEGMIVNVGPLVGGSVTNAVPDHAACWGNVRYADPERGMRLGAAIDALASTGDGLPRVVVHRRWNRPAKPRTPAVTSFAEGVRAAAADLGMAMPFVATGGVCDGNIMQEVGLPTLDTLGVRGGNLHRTDEFVELASLVDRAQLLAISLIRLADGRIRPVIADGGSAGPPNDR
jgi:glutamate carboxypeptidase